MSKEDAWIPAAAQELASHFSFGKGRDAYVTPKQRQHVANNYTSIIERHYQSRKGMDVSWIGVDLDGTLAHYDGWRGDAHIGAPILPMVERVRKWLSEERNVRIFTARVSGHRSGLAAAERPIEAWCLEHIGMVLPITCVKDFAMVELWDDRCVRIVTNTGKVALNDLQERYERLAASIEPK